MKKVLFASTALVMTAGVAAAEVKVTGEAQIGLNYNGTTTVVNNDIDFNVVGSGSTDGGLSFGASVDLDASDSDSATTTGSVADPEVYVEMNGVKLSVGDISSAANQGGIADLGYDGIGVDNQAEINTLAAQNVRVDYAFGDVKVAASINSSNNDWAVGGSASFDAITVALGFGESGTAQQTRLTVGYSAGAVSGKIFYAEDGSETGQGLEVSYTSGDVTVTGVYADNNGAGDQSAYGIGVAYDLGGATLAGGIGEVSGTTMADLGITFKF